MDANGGSTPYIDVEYGKAGNVTVNGMMDEDAYIYIYEASSGHITVRGGMYDGANILCEYGRYGNISVGGPMDANGGSAPYIDVWYGYAGNVTVNGFMDEGAYIYIYKASSRNITVRGGMYDGAYLDLEYGRYGNIAIGGPMDANGGSAPYVYVYCAGMGSVTVNGMMDEGAYLDLEYVGANNITVAGGMYDGSYMNLWYGEFGNIFVGGPMDSLGGDTPYIYLYGGGSGNVTVGGRMYDAYIYYDYGSAGNFNIAGGMYYGSYIDCEYGEYGNISIGGPMDPLGGSSPYIDMFHGQMGNVLINGGMYDGAYIYLYEMIGGTFFVNGPMDSAGGSSPYIYTYYGASGGVTVNGFMDNASLRWYEASILDGSNIRVLGDFRNDSYVEIYGGRLGSFQVQGDFVESDFYMYGGDTGLFRVGGNMIGDIPGWDFCDIDSYSTIHSFLIGGYASYVNIDIDGSNGVFQIGRYAEDVDLDVEGSIGRISIGGFANDVPGGGNMYLYSDAAIGSILVNGGADGLQIDEYGPMSHVGILGDYANGRVWMGGDVGLFRVTGAVSDTEIDIDGYVRSFVIGGALLGDGVGSDDITFDGETGVFSVGMGMDTYGVQFGARVNSVRVGGPVVDSVIAVTQGGFGTMTLLGAVDNTVIQSLGPSGLLRTTGAVVGGSNLAFMNGLKSLIVGGGVDTSTINVVNGGEGLPPATVQIGGDIIGSGVSVFGDCPLFSVNGGLFGSNVTVTGYATSIIVRGDVNALSTVGVGQPVVSPSGQTYYSGTLRSMNVIGLIYGTVNVLGTLHAINSAGTLAGPDGPPAPPFTGTFAPNDAGGAPTGGVVQYVTLAPGGYVS